MRLLNQTCSALVQESGVDGIYKQIEKAGRTCYKSTDKITEESAKPFVDRMIKSNHTAMLEHGSIYLIIKEPYEDKPSGRLVGHEKYRDNPYSKVVDIPIRESWETWHYITTNLRVIIENNWKEDLQYICEPTEYHEKRYTLLCTTALHCYKDLTRHRVFSFAIESTRFCNYSKTEKFGEMAFIIPTWITHLRSEGVWKGESRDNSGNYTIGDNTINIKELVSLGVPVNEITNECIFYTALSRTENTYNSLIKNGWQAQQAAEVLPQCIKADMVISGFESDWKHLLDLRYYGTTGAPHPMVKELASLMKVELEKLGFAYDKC